VYIHPLEAFLYYCILYAPPFLFRMPVCSFIGYMIIMGLCGTIDHSGIMISIPGFYDASGKPQWVIVCRGVSSLDTTV
jgi:hypothetical protein